MKINVLGFNGGIGNGSGSTCILLGKHILIDAGSGLEKLSLEEMHQIKHVVLTHAHMDHISALPTFLSNLFDIVKTPVTIHALPETLDALNKHIFNWYIWPDFTQLPSPDTPIMRYVPVQAGETFQLESYLFQAFNVTHTVPTVGYSIQTNQHHFVFTGDTKASSELIQSLDQLGPIDTLMVECAFPDQYSQLAQDSCHLTPSSLLKVVHSLKQTPKNIWVSHLKPTYEQELRGIFSTRPEFKNWHILGS